MLRLTSTHCRIINKGCSNCLRYKEEPQVTIIHEILDTLHYNVEKKEILNIVCDRYVQVIELRCFWCGEPLFIGKSRYASR